MLIFNGHLNIHAQMRIAVGMLWARNALNTLLRFVFRLLCDSQIMRRFVTDSAPFSPTYTYDSFVSGHWLTTARYTNMGLLLLVSDTNATEKGRVSPTKHIWIYPKNYLSDGYATKMCCSEMRVITTILCCSIRYHYCLSCLPRRL